MQAFYTRLNSIYANHVNGNFRLSYLIADVFVLLTILQAFNDTRSSSFLVIIYNC